MPRERRAPDELVRQQRGLLLGVRTPGGWNVPVFAVRCRELGIRVRYIKPRRPQQNRKVERSHRIDEQEFWTRHLGTDFNEATVALAAWAHRYNHDRFSMALHGRTPMEKLAAVFARRAPPLSPGGFALAIH